VEIKEKHNNGRRKKRFNACRVKGHYLHSKGMRTQGTARVWAQRGKQQDKKARERIHPGKTSSTQGERGEPYISALNDVPSTCKADTGGQIRCDKQTWRLGKSPVVSVFYSIAERVRISNDHLTKSPGGGTVRGRPFQPGERKGQNNNASLLARKKRRPTMLQVQRNGRESSAIWGRTRRHGGQK